MPEVSRINGPFLKRTPDGVIVTIVVVERNTISEVDFIGNRGISDRALKKQTGLEDGRPLDVHEIRMAKTKIEEYYKEKGYPRTQVEIMEGNETGDAKVTFLIHEDEKQRIWKAGIRRQLDRHRCSFASLHSIQAGHTQNVWGRPGQTG